MFNTHITVLLNKCTAIKLVFTSESNKYFSIYIYSCLINTMSPITYSITILLLLVDKCVRYIYNQLLEVDVSNYMVNSHHILRIENIIWLNLRSVAYNLYVNTHIKQINLFYWNSHTSEKWYWLANNWRNISRFQNRVKPEKKLYFEKLKTINGLPNFNYKVLVIQVKI